MDQPDDSRNASGDLDRRKFLGALGAAAAAGFLLKNSGHANAQSQQYYYQDSFGDIVPAGDVPISFGIYPPPIPQSDGDGPDAFREHREHLERGRGVHPEDDPPPPAPNNPTYYASSEYPMYNFLLIMVDQLRNPRFWVPPASGSTSGEQLIANATPYISKLASTSFTFPNYFTAATVCGPARSCLLTGLYAQQHGIFKSASTFGSNNGSMNPNFQEPSLLPYNPSWSAGNATVGFPTIGNVLSQTLPIGSTGAGGSAHYDCTWIGKWHVSCLGNYDNRPGNNGPQDYGFDALYSLPTTSSTKYPLVGSYPSPDGYENEGCGGDFLDSYLSAQRDVPTYNNTGLNYSGTYGPISNYVQLNDAAIAGAFLDYWLPNANSTLNGLTSNGTLANPWFCAVSFINPHDISDFPYSYGISGANNFGSPAHNPNIGYLPAPKNLTGNNSFNGTHCSSSNCAAVDDVMFIPQFSAPYSSLPPGAGNAGPWNWEDLTLPSLQYANNGNGKPGMQYYYMNNRDQACGTIGPPGTYNNGNNSWPTPQAWTTFLNYYLWMQSCVDYQIGRVLGYVTGQLNPGISGYPTFWGNTIVVFTSDHGEYGGSHGLHAKGGALYDEAMNVPLYISYPQMRNGTGPQNGSIPYVCSSVDLLPYLYTAALGNHSWRNNNNDMVAYLNQRESIQDAIMEFMSSGPNVIQQRRISSIPLQNNVCGGSCTGNWQFYQPFVLHSADDFAYAIDYSGNYTPSHALAFRTVDITDNNTQTAPYFGRNGYGGGKLGSYSYWDTCANQTYPANNALNQYEFYNYSENTTFARNPQEVGNQYFESSSNTTPTTLAQQYQNDFFNVGSPAGINVMTEFYDLRAPASYAANAATAQVTAAIPVAMQNYMEYLWCNSVTSNGNNTGPTNCGNTSPKNSTTCPPFEG